MRTALTAFCFLALSTSAFASETTCTGTRYGMQDHDIVTLDINSDSAHACKVLYNEGTRDIAKYCNVDDYCAFRGHAVSRDGNLYVVDFIEGPISE